MPAKCGIAFVLYLLSGIETFFVFTMDGRGYGVLSSLSGIETLFEGETPLPVSPFYTYLVELKRKLDFGETLAKTRFYTYLVELKLYCLLLISLFNSPFYTDLVELKP